MILWLDLDSVPEIYLRNIYKYSKILKSLKPVTFLVPNILNKVYSCIYWCFETFYPAKRRSQISS